MNWAALLWDDCQGVFETARVLGAAVLLCAVLWVAWQALRRLLGLRVEERARAANRLVPPDPRTVRLSEAGLPPPLPFEVGTSPAANLGGIIGPGTPLMGPAPPSVSLEPEEHVLRVELEEPPEVS